MDVEIYKINSDALMLNNILGINETENYLVLTQETPDGIKYVNYNHSEVKGYTVTGLEDLSSDDEKEIALEPKEEQTEIKDELKEVPEEQEVIPEVKDE